MQRHSHIIDIACANTEMLESALASMINVDYLCFRSRIFFDRHALDIMRLSDYLKSHFQKRTIKLFEIIISHIDDSTLDRLIDLNKTHPICTFEIVIVEPLSSAKLLHLNQLKILHIFFRKQLDEDGSNVENIH